MASVASENNDSIVLNIMPMLDIFSILILFLLMNFSTDPMTHDITKGVELPISYSINSLDEQPSVSISRDAIWVNYKKIINLELGKIADNYGDQGTIPRLVTELQKISEIKSHTKRSK